MPRVKAGFQVLGSVLATFGTAAVLSLKQVGLRQPFLVLAALGTSACHAVKTAAQAVVLNDVHSRLNPTTVTKVLSPRSTSELVHAIRAAKRDGQSVSISAGRHAMGGQQFGTETAHISMSQMDDVLSFDRQRGVVRVEAGIGWPTLFDYLRTNQPGPGPIWAVALRVQGRVFLGRLFIGRYAAVDGDSLNWHRGLR